MSVKSVCKIAEKKTDRTDSKGSDEKDVVQTPEQVENLANQANSEDGEAETDGEKPSSVEKPAPDPNKIYVDKSGKEYKFKPKRNSEGKPNRDGDYVDKNNRAWSKPTTHGQTHNEHRDIQLPNGQHITVIPKE